jgi:hypothetical protein
MVEGPAVLEALAGVVIGVQQGQLLREVLVDHSWAEHADQLITCVLLLNILGGITACGWCDLRYYRGRVSVPFCINTAKCRVSSKFSYH